MKSRIVICRSNPIAPDPRVEKTARTLNQAGCDITLVGWDRSDKLHPEEDVSGITYVRLLIKAKPALGMLNIPDLLRWQWRLMMWLLSYHNEFDLIHACDFDTVLPALVCAKLYKKKVVYDIFDFYVDMLRKTPPFIKGMIRQLDLWVISQVNGVILADDSRKHQISSAKLKHFKVIYNSPQDLLDSLGGQPVSPQGHLRISYIGLLQHERGLFDLIDVVSNHAEWDLDLGGSGPEEEKIMEWIHAHPNIHWHGLIPYSKSLERNFVADVMIAIFDPSIPNHRYSSSNKLFEAMMLQKPIIVARNTNMDRKVQMHNCGIVINYGNLVALEGALQKLANDPVLRLKLGKNSRLAYEKEYNWEKMQMRLLNYYTEILRD